MTSRFSFGAIADGNQESLFTAALGVLVSLISLLVAVPLAGGLTRYRAQYSPRRVSLGADGEQSPSCAKAGSASYFGTIAKTYKKEGFSGLYRGLVPTILQLVLLIAFAVLVVFVTRQHDGAYPIPMEMIPSDFFHSLILALVAVPLTILTYRSMTVPVPLSVSSPLQSTRTAFSSYERTRPWTLYTLPGLVAVQVIYVIFCPLVLRLLRQLILSDPTSAPGYDTGLVGKDNTTGAWWNAAVYIIFIVFVSLILAPLEVISVRLAVQREMPKGSTMEANENSPLTGNTLEPLIELRSGGEYYTGLVDCARKIMDEEGWCTLYRAWWCTLLVTLGIAFA